MATKIERILFATDMSQNSVYAMHHLVGLAKLTGAKVRVLNVCPPMSEDTRITLMTFIQDPAARKDAVTRRLDISKETLQTRQDEFWAALPAEDQAVRDQIEALDVVEGYPAEVILRHTKEHNCDLIVLGAHEHGLSQTFLGSVARRVLRRADVPTLVVPYRDDV